MQKDTGILHFLLGFHCWVVDFIPALVLNSAWAWLQHNEVLICHLILLPNTSNATLIELLIKCQDLRLWGTGGKCLSESQETLPVCPRCLSYITIHFLLYLLLPPPHLIIVSNSIIIGTISVLISTFQRQLLAVLLVICCFFVFVLVGYFIHEVFFILQTDSIYSPYQTRAKYLLQSKSFQPTHVLSYLNQHIFRHLDHAQLCSLAQLSIDR